MPCYISISTYMSIDIHMGQSTFLIEYCCTDQHGSKEIIMLDTETIAFWNKFYQESLQDKQWTEASKELDGKRSQAIVEMHAFVNQFLLGSSDLSYFKDTFDKRTRVEWVSFGFKGFTGAMTLNMIVNDSDDKDICQQRLRYVIPEPQSDQDIQVHYDSLLEYVNLLNQSLKEQRKIRIGNLPFFLSMWWHIQNQEIWPVYYPSARIALQKTKSYTSQNEPAQDYQDYRSCYRSLMKVLHLNVWELEHLFFRWYDIQIKGKQAPSKTGINEPIDEKSLSNVFISYSHQDKELIEPILEALRQSGFPLWIDDEKLIPGTSNWDRSIKRGIQSSDFVLYMASRNAIHSDTIFGELRFARAYEKVIIPIWLDGERWVDVIPLEFNGIQGLDARGIVRDKAIKALIERTSNNRVPS
jgi:TIR domain